MSPLIRYSGLAFLTVEYLLEHLQLMSFMRMSLETGNTWNTDADDTWDALENLALRFEDSSHDALYWIGLALTLIVFFAYFILYPWIHRLHKENNSCFQWFIIFLDHIIFGCGFIPIVANLSPVWYCNSTGEM